jgi:CHAT domain-containing protein
VAREHLEKLVERARAFRTKVDREAWRELYDLLIQPVRRYLPHTGGAELTVVPHGALLDLPFAALLDKRGRYLAEDFSLRIAPSMGYAGVDGGKREGRYLLVGAPVRPATDAQGRRLAALPGASIELEKIGRITRTKTVLRGGEAMGGRVREALAEAKVVHFATHAVVDDKRPFDSFLALSEGEKLTAREVYGMELKADLVVLSACRSGSGKVTSDGLLGFTRAFLYAGAGAVIAPLWDIADEPTARLMDEFYRQYGAGVAKSAALRMAQLKLIGDLRSGRVVVDTAIGPVALGEHPALWAGFVVQGGN